MNQRTLNKASKFFNTTLKGLVLGTAISAAISAAGPAAYANSASTMSDGDLLHALQEAFMKHFNYSGQYRKTMDRGYGIGCKKTRDFYVHWSSSLKDLDVSLTEDGIAKFVFNLEGSKAYISYGGNTSLCMYKGYFGDVLTNNIRGEFHIIPNEGKHATIDIKSLQISNLQFVNWTLFDPFLLDVQGDAPQFINDWTQNSFNGLVRTFLKSSFSDRLDRFVSDKIEEELKRRYDGGPDLQFVQAQDSSLLVH